MGSRYSLAAVLALIVFGSCAGGGSTTPQTFSISGRALDSVYGAGIAGASVTLNPGDLTQPTDASGNYSFSGLAAGSYLLTVPSVAGYAAFTPASVNVTVGPDAMGEDFSAAPSSGAVTYETGAGVIKTLMDQHCAVCHSPGTHEGGRPYFRSWAEVSPYVADINYHVLPPEDGGLGDMPQRPQSLTDDERHKFKLWADGGNPE